jgi:oligopeptide transport system permease protein
MRNIEARYGLDDPYVVQIFNYVKNIVLHFDFGPVLQAADQTVTGLIASGFPVTLTYGSLAFALAVGAGAWRWGRGGDPAQHLARLRRHGLGHRGLGAAELRAGAACWCWSSRAWLTGCPRAAGAAGNWVGRGHAGDRAVDELHGRHRADHALLHDRGDEFGLHPHGARQGPAHAAHHPAPRAQARAAARPELSGPGLRGDDHGSVVIDVYFSTEGIGQFFVNSALSRDYSVIMGVTILVGVLTILFNLLVDVLYAWIDPKIRY